MNPRFLGYEPSALNLTGLPRNIPAFAITFGCAFALIPKSKDARPFVLTMVGTNFEIWLTIQDGLAFKIRQDFLSTYSHDVAFCVNRFLGVRRASSFSTFRICSESCSSFLRSGVVSRHTFMTSCHSFIRLRSDDARGSWVCSA